jgi:acetylornithine/N-succinyldiaminopimelate aminotransferase
MIDDKLADKAASTGSYFLMMLGRLQERYPDKILEVRGRRLLLGMELAKPGKPIVDACLQRGMIINCTAGNVIRLVPPLIISKVEIDALLSVLDEVFQEF